MFGVYASVYLCSHFSAMTTLILDLGGMVHIHRSMFQILGGMMMIYCLMNEIVTNSFPFLLKNGLFPADGCKWHPLSLLESALRSPGKAFCGATLRPSGIIKGVSLRIMAFRASPPLPPYLHDLGQVTEPFWGPAVLLCKVETTLKAPEGRPADGWTPSSPGWCLWVGQVTARDTQKAGP